ncbi:MAG TPA: diaminopimelate epimerase [Vicinamibacterales bacterium]|nr:diaminopimelate epimerase [Vicinamibacterales bacterium]
MNFTKAHAYGNDFLYVLAADAGGGPHDALARELCDRHAGIGADGLILYTPSRRGAEMQLLNADGSPSEVSGNGVRGLAAILLRDQPENGAGVTIGTAAGDKYLVRTARSGSHQTFRAAMGLPRDIRQLQIAAGGEPLSVVSLNIGNPQCLVLGAIPDEERFNRVGAALEHHPAFPEGTNVEFVRVDAPDRVTIRIWERGVGPTLSSGTGSCASLVAAACYGGASRDAIVAAPGGEQRVEWRDDNVYLTGWAEILFDGVWLRSDPSRER